MRKIMLLAAFAMVFSFAGSAMAADGAGLYASKCAMCHGKDGSGGAMAPGLKGTDFTKGDAAAIKTVIKAGRSGDAKKFKNINVAMPKFDTLKDDEVDALVAFIKGLK